MRVVNLLMLLLLHLLFANPALGFELAMYIPNSLQKAQTIQQALSKSCTDISVIAFGRSKDFRKYVKNSKPNSILSVAEALNNHPEYQVAVQGLINEKASEPYVLVSIDSIVDTSKLHEITVGVADFLGRRKIKSFLQQQLGEGVNIKPVAKAVDLILILTFDVAEAIFVPISLLKKFKTQSKLNFVVTPTDVELKLLSAAVSTKEDKNGLADCLKNLDMATNKMLGVETWVE